jgi:hypothetical protein
MQAIAVVVAVLRVFRVGGAGGGGELVGNAGGKDAFIFTEMPDPALISKYYKNPLSDLDYVSFADFCSNSFAYVCARAKPTAP